MPKVRGFTAAENRKRDEIAKAVEREGGSVNPWAVATARVKKTKAKKRKR